MSELPEGYEFTRIYNSRVSESRDLACYVTDYQNSRGTGKTVFSLKLAELMDRTGEGLTKEKVFIDPTDLIEAYVEMPKGSALVLDEAEVSMSKYRAGSSMNMALRQIVSMGRVREKYLVLNLPSSSELDRDLKSLLGYWWLVLRKGVVQGHRISNNPYRETVYTPKSDNGTTWKWSDIEPDSKLSEIYEYIHEEKMKHLKKEGSMNSMFTKSDVDNLVSKARNEASRKTRDELVTSIYENGDYTQMELANLTGIPRGTLAPILAESSN
jgi:hypothetical protein